MTKNVAQVFYVSLGLNTASKLILFKHISIYKVLIYLWVDSKG